MKKALLSIALLLLAGGVSAQDKLVKKARNLVEESKEKQADGSVILNKEKLAEAQATLSPALTSGTTKDMATAWDVQGDIYQLIFGEELNKAAMQMPLDTTVFAENLSACIDAYEKCGAVDEKQKYTAKNKSNLKKFRTYYIYCGQFFSNNGQHEKAYDAFDQWLAFPNKYKLVAGDPSVQKDSLIDENMIAFYACLSAYNAKHYDWLDKYMEQALNYEKEINTARQLRLLSHLEQGDTAQWVASSKKFALADMSNEAIAQNLLAYYFEKGDFASAMSFADELLAADAENKIANYTKGVVLFNQGKNADAIPFFDKTIQIDPAFSDAYYNAGVCYCNQGYEINEAIGAKKLTMAQGKVEIAKVKDMYRKAEPYFLKVKELNPDRPERWASRLKTVYYIIEDKDKEAEMDAYIN